MKQQMFHIKLNLLYYSFSWNRVNLRWRRGNAFCMTNGQKDEIENLSSTFQDRGQIEQLGIGDLICAYGDTEERRNEQNMKIAQYETTKYVREILAKQSLVSSALGDDHWTEIFSRIICSRNSTVI